MGKNANDKFKKSWRNKHQLISSSCSNKFSQEKRKTIPPNFITESSKRLWRIKRYLQKFVGSANQKDLIMYRETSFSNLRKKTFSEGNSNLPDLELDLDCTDNNCLHVVSVTQLWTEYRAPKVQIHLIIGHLSIWYSNALTIWFVILCCMFSCVCFTLDSSLCSRKKSQSPS